MDEKARFKKKGGSQKDRVLEPGAGGCRSFRWARLSNATHERQNAARGLVKNKSVLFCWRRTGQFPKIEMKNVWMNFRCQRNPDRMNFFNRACAFLVLVVAGILCPKYADAACMGYIGMAPYRIFFGDVIVPATARIGVPFYTRQWYIPTTGNPIGRCFNGGNLVYKVEYGRAVPGFDNVYETNLKGIGYRLKYAFGIGPNSTLRTLPFLQYLAGNTEYALGNPQMFQVELVLTADDVETGNLFSGNMFTGSADGNGFINILAEIDGSASRVILPTCEVAAADRKVTVPLGSANRSNFTGVGKTSNDTDFFIKLTCRAGLNAQRTITLRMDGVVADRENGVLRLTNPNDSSTAKGVGIQVIKDTRPVRFGDRVPLTVASTGVLSLKYSARFYQIDNAVSGGKANSTATFTIEYR